MIDFLLAVAGLFAISAVVVGGTTALLFKEHIWSKAKTIDSEKQRILISSRASGLAYIQTLELISGFNEISEPQVDVVISLLEQNTFEREAPLQVNQLPRQVQALLNFGVQVTRLNQYRSQEIPAYAV